VSLCIKLILRYKHLNSNLIGKKGKVIAVTGHEGPWGCEMLRLPHFLDTQLTDSNEIISLTFQPPFVHKKIPGTHIYERNSVAKVFEGTIPTERPPLVGEVSANFC
jgi:hypothetical protein